MKEIDIKETFKVPGTSIVVESGSKIEVVERVSPREITKFSGNVQELSQVYNPDELAEIIVTGIMDGISESEYGSDDRFLTAFRSALSQYSI